jgi:hypothetical protein
MDNSTKEECEHEQLRKERQNLNVDNWTEGKGNFSTDN